MIRALPIERTGHGCLIYLFLSVCWLGGPDSGRGVCGWRGRDCRLVRSARLRALASVAGEDPLEGVTEADPAELAVLAGAALGSAMITVGVERWLFRRGEGRRAQGVRFAHTRQGLALGGLEAALTVLTFGAGAVRERLSKG